MIIPPFLKPKDKIGIIAPAGRLAPNTLSEELIELNSWDLEVVEGRFLYHTHHRFAGNDQQRLGDIQEMLERPEIKAIFCARGGYGTSRILDQINFSSLKENPKWIIGFSDITTFLCLANQLGVACIHGIMPSQFGQKASQASKEMLKNFLFGKPLVYNLLSHSLNKTGNVQAEIIGGNLSLLAHLTGTSTQARTKGKILFIEEIGEHLYHIDRMMIQLKRAGIFQDLAGLIVGHFTEIKDNDTVKFGKTAYQIVKEHIEEYNFPVCFGFPAGHEEINMPLPFGLKANFKVEESGTTLNFRG
ncbi:S66 peptidase family protein [Xanthovirga aplysinae]|uniref:S66 peptidase family protein n=1 Tax=Xanthovirga aplysinae TaxID=2529853 RepID=UPI0012BD30AD|nr:LD-carboxypeptidase [Xanthovirga aplysinae]MTI31650.1 LD-carboxypeptidase [Xanthovirga aplysinae]